MIYKKSDYKIVYFNSNIPIILTSENHHHIFESLGYINSIDLKKKDNKIVFKFDTENKIYKVYLKDINLKISKDFIKIKDWFYKDVIVNIDKIKYKHKNIPFLWKDIEKIDYLHFRITDVFSNEKNTEKSTIEFQEKLLKNLNKLKNI